MTQFMKSKLVYISNVNQNNWKINECLCKIKVLQTVNNFSTQQCVNFNFNDIGFKFKNSNHRRELTNCTHY